MHKTQRVVADMPTDVLARQAGARADRTGEPFEEALRIILETDAGQRPGELGDGPHREERARGWQEDLVREYVRDRKREHAEKRKQAELAAKWQCFMETELRELELRKAGQLAKMLGEPQPGEPREALERLASEDQRQAQKGMVALISMGKASYRHISELSAKDMPARMAANRLREAWLKDRGDGWLRDGPGSG